MRVPTYPNQSFPLNTTLIRSTIGDPPAWLRASNFDDDKAQKSANPQHDMKRQSYTMGGLYCRGQPCSTHTACQIMGCHSCVFVDNYVKKMCR